MRKQEQIELLKLQNQNTHSPKAVCEKKLHILPSLYNPSEEPCENHLSKKQLKDFYLIQKWLLHIARLI